MLGDEPLLDFEQDTCSATAETPSLWQTQISPMFVIVLSVADLYFDCQTARGLRYEKPYGDAYIMSMVLPVTANLTILAHFIYGRIRQSRSFRNWAMQNSGTVAIASALALLRIDCLSILYSRLCGLVSGLSITLFSSLE